MTWHNDKERLVTGYIKNSIINSYVRNPVDETTLDRVAFLIRDCSLTLSGVLSSDELNDVISHVSTS